MHCHIEYHVLNGMALVIQSGETWQMPPAPRRMARCGDFSISEDEFEDAEEFSPPRHRNTNRGGGYTDTEDGREYHSTELILGLRPANERRRYRVTPSLIGWS